MTIANSFDLVILDWAGTMLDFGCRAAHKHLNRELGSGKVALHRATMDHP